MKEKSQEQELTRTEVARKIAKESERGLKKGRENGTEQCREVERVQKEMKQYRTMREPERARAQERKRNTQKIDSEG